MPLFSQPPIGVLIEEGEGISAQDAKMVPGCLFFFQGFKYI